MTPQEFFNLVRGKKIRWTGWPDELYCILHREARNGEFICTTYNSRTGWICHNDHYVMGEGISFTGPRGSHWYFVDKDVGVYLSNQGTEAWY